MKKIFFLFIISFSIIGSIEFLYSQDGIKKILLTDSTDKKVIGQSLYYLEDSDNSITINTITSEKYKDKFKLGDVDRPNFGFTNSTYWIRFTVINNSSRVGWLLIEKYGLDYTELYSPKDNGTFNSKKLGWLVPFSERNIRYRYPAFNLYIESNKEKTYYIKLNNESLMQCSLEIFSDSQFFEKVADEHIILGLYYGFIFSMLLFNLLVFLTFRDISYLYFLLFLICYGLFQTTINCLAFQYLWPNSILINKYSYLYLEYLSFLCGIQFARSFLNTKVLIPVLDKVFKYIVYLTILLILLIPAIPIPYLYKINAILSLTSPIIVVATSAACLKKGSQSARFYLLAWSLFLVGIILFSLRSIGIIPSNFISQYGIQIGSIFLIMLLSLALTDRINIYRREKEKYQNDLISNLNRIDKLKDEFLANTSHELRTPLNGIIGITESIIDGATGAISDILNKNLRLIVISGKRLLNLVNDILDFSKMKNNELIINKKPTDMKQLVEIILELLKPAFKDKYLEIINQIPDNAPLVFGDENRIQQILYNLLGNAIKFTEKGSIIIKSQVRNNMLDISISDTGIGIPSDKLDDIFRSFEQVDSSLTREYGGTGLGLSITKKLVELHDGNISVQSEQDKGSTFTFSLPIIHENANNKSEKINNTNIINHRDDLNSVLNQIENINEISVSQKSKNSSLIMAIDDEPINLHVIVNQLRVAGYNVITATNGLEALEILKDNIIPDIILLDIMMPKMNGYELCKQLRKDYSLYELPIIMLTAKNQVYDIVTGFESGANDYISKPFDKKELYVRLNTLLSLKNAIKVHDKLQSIEQELELARKIQSSLLPKDMPIINGIEINAIYKPMKEVGGDFYDFYVEDENNFGVLMADISGHGVPAAIISSTVKLAFTIQKENMKSPDKILNLMNKCMLGNIGEEYMTASYLYFNMIEKKLYHSSAAHPPIYIWKEKEKQIIESKPTGKIIGYYEDIKINVEDVSISSGDKIIIYTDGVTECFDPNDEMFDDTRLKEFIVKHHTDNCRDFSNLLLEELKNWSKKNYEFEDDVSIVIIDVL